MILQFQRFKVVALLPNPALSRKESLVLDRQHREAIRYSGTAYHAITTAIGDCQFAGNSLPERLADFNSIVLSLQAVQSKLLDMVTSIQKE
jgi:hypothetical protein